MKSDPFALCLSNTVAANFAANVLLAIGAKPAMIEEPAEGRDSGHPEGRGGERAELLRLGGRR